MSETSRNVLAVDWSEPVPPGSAERACVTLAREVEALEERITTMCDEECGLQPVQSADDSLTMIEHRLCEWRNKHRALDAKLAEAERKVAEVRRSADRAMRAGAVPQSVDMATELLAILDGKGGVMGASSWARASPSAGRSRASSSAGRGP